MNIKNSFRRFINQTLSGVRRFPLPAFFGFAVFVSSAIYLFAPQPKNEAGKAVSSLNDAALHAAFASAFAFFTSTAATLVALRFSLSRKIRAALYVFSVALWIPGFFLAKKMDEFNYASLAYWGGICICILIALYLCVTAFNEKTVFLHILKAVVFAEWIAGIASVGLWISLWAVNELIVPIKNIDEYMLLISVFSQALIAVNVFLSQLSFEKAEFPVARMYKALVFYAAFPVYVIYVAVLYVYLAKILVTRNMPGGQINIFVSLATAFYLFFYCTLKAFPGRAADIFYKIGTFVMLPCIAAQLIAVWIRFDAYGLTAMRWAGLLYTVSVLFFIIVALLKKNAPRAWLLFAAFLCAVSTLTPLSLTRVPSLEQKARLEKILHECGYYTDGYFTLPAESVIAQIPYEKRRAMVSAYNELLSEHKAAYQGSGALSGDSDFKTVFGFAPSKDRQDNEVYKCYEWTKHEIDISSYSLMLPTRGSDYRNPDSGRIFTKVPLSVQKTKYDIFDALLAMPESGEDFIVALDDITTLYITSVTSYYDRERKGFTQYRYEGFVLKKR
ncbi:DUF4153 domain-containing protein [Treponema socranskii]|uniref:DUF4153 domain-containing protein n=1 Tax=Treponema socranskii TaxID=53419 RepID=UPI003D6DC417